MRKLCLSAALLCLLAAACAPLSGGSLPGTSGSAAALAKIVQATLSAMTEQAPKTPVALLPSATGAVVLTPGSATGSISGSLTYPADSLPPMYVTAFQVGTQSYRYVITQAGQGTYEIDSLAPGKYNIVAYTIGGNGFPADLQGGYTQAVPCGLATECANHVLIDVPLAAGQVVKGISPSDWNAPAGTFPAFPQSGLFATPVGTPAGAGTGSPGSGSIAGHLKFPASALPGLRVVAFKVGSQSYYYIETSPGDSSFRLDNIPSGTYHVVAYSLPENGTPADAAGGYTKMVPCGLTAACTDHSLIDVTVNAGQVTSGIDPDDYSAPAGAFPPDPVP